MKLLLAALLWLLASLALAGRWTPAEEARALALGNDLRCPVCAGETVSQSTAALARHMLGQIKSQIRSGRSDPQILAYFVARYGRNILLTPPHSGLGLLIWLLPAAALLVGGGLYLRYLRRQDQPDGSAPPEERLAEVDRLIRENSPPELGREHR